MEKWYGFVYYPDLASFMLTKTKDEHAKDVADNVVIVESDGKLIFSFIVDLLFVTTDGLTYEQAYEAFGLKESWLTNRKKRINKERLNMLYDYVAENNLLGFVYSLLDGNYKIFKEGCELI